MDKDEVMIKNMASIICKETSNKGLCEKCGFKKHKQFGHTYQCRKFDDAEALYNAGCRKIGDDEIVVKKQAYEKFVEEFAKQEEIAHSYEQGYTELLETNHQLQDELEKAKQETREILTAINKYLVGTRGIYTVKTFRNCRFEDILLVRADDLETLVKKLAKEHDVELED